MPLASGIVAALADIVGPYNLVSAGGTVFDAGSLPDVVVFPGTAGEVAQIIRGAVACEVAVQTSEGMTLREGDAGRITLNLARFDEILEINAATLTARLQPCLVLDRLWQELSAAGLQLAHAPRVGPATSTDYVLAVEAVSASGRVFRAQRFPYGRHDELVDLVVHGEGVHWVITELTVALLPALARQRP